MARAKKSAADDELDFLTGIAAQTGGEMLSEVGTIPYWCDTGNLAINYINSGKFINGGLPGGRIIEVFGAEATGKSILGYCLMGNVQRSGGIAITIDAERSSNAEFASTAGHVNPKRMLVYPLATYEQIEQQIIETVKKIREHSDKPIFIMWDSIGVTLCEREWKEIELPKNASKAQIKEAGGNERPGERARAAGDALRKLNPFLNENGATLYIINQIRSKVGVIFGSPETTAGGGKALPFYASIRIRMSSDKEIRDKKRDLPIGYNLKIRNKKNRHFNPGLDTFGVQLYFNAGINPLSGLLRSLINAGRIEEGKGGTELGNGKGTMFKVLPQWLGPDGEAVCFKSSDVNNSLPVEVLLKCPALIDAEDSAQVQAYIDPWTKAMALSENEDVAEIKIEDETEKLMGDDYYQED